MNKKNQDEFILNYKFNKDNLIDIINSINTKNKVISKKIYNFIYNININFSISWYKKDMTWNYINLSVILWISKWERISIIQLSLNEIHVKETSIL